MKNLYDYIQEGILDNADIAISNMDKALNKFGNNFELEKIIGITKTTQSMLSSKNLKPISKILKPINTYNGKYKSLPTKWEDKLINLLVFLDNIDISEFIKHELTYDIIREQLSKYISEQCFKAGVFNTELRSDKIQCWLTYDNKQDLVKLYISSNSYKYIHDFIIISYKSINKIN